MSVFTERLVVLRKKRKLTQTKVASYLGIAQASYIRYEKGTSEPTLENLAKICDLLDVTADYLMGREDFLAKKMSSLFDGGKAVSVE